MLLLNTVVGIVGIVVGIIGICNMHEAKKIKNMFNDCNIGNILQGDNNHIGLDDVTVVGLSQDTAKKEVEKVSETVNEVYEEVKKMPRIHVGTEKPEDGKDGDIWFKVHE